MTLRLETAKWGVWLISFSHLSAYNSRSPVREESRVTWPRGVAAPWYCNSISAPASPVTVTSLVTTTSLSLSHIHRPSWWNSPQFAHICISNKTPPVDCDWWIMLPNWRERSSAAGIIVFSINVESPVGILIYWTTFPMWSHNRLCRLSGHTNSRRCLFWRPYLESSVITSSY